jgi:hypothetical protein
VSLILAGVAPERRREHLHKAVQILFNIGLAEDEGLNIGVQTGLVAKVFAPKRIRQEAHIRDDIGVSRNSVLETERLNDNIDFGRGL